LLLQGAKPRKYGPNPGFTRKRLAKAERKRIEAEVRAERRARDQARPTAAQVDAVLDTRLVAMARAREPRLLADGWTRDGEHWIPPGWVRSPADPQAPAIEGAKEIGDSV